MTRWGASPKHRTPRGHRRGTSTFRQSLGQSLRQARRTQTGVVAGNVNTIDEVPDSSWFTNRILARPVSIEEAVRAAGTGDGPASGQWTVSPQRKLASRPGSRSWIEGRDLVRVIRRAWSPASRDRRDSRREQDLLDPGLLAGRQRVDQRPARAVAARRYGDGSAPFLARDADASIGSRRGGERAHRDADGSYRAVAARRLPGRPLGGFRYPRHAGRTIRTM